MEDELLELIDELEDVIDGRHGAQVVSALTTVLRSALKCAPPDDRQELIEDVCRFLKEPYNAAQ